MDNSVGRSVKVKFKIFYWNRYLKPKKMLPISNLFANATKNNTSTKILICGKCNYVNSLYTYIFVQTHKNRAFD